MKSKIFSIPPKPECPPNEIMGDPLSGLSSPLLGLVVLLGLLVLSLAGCAPTPVASPDFVPTPVTFMIKVPYVCGQPPGIDVVSLSEVEFDPIEVDGGEYVATSMDDYTDLGENVSKWIAASKQLKAQRNFYLDCILRSRAEAAKDNLDQGLTPVP